MPEPIIANIRIRLPMVSSIVNSEFAITVGQGDIRRPIDIVNCVFDIRELRG